MSKIIGDQAFIARLRAIRSPATQERIGQALFVAAGEIQAEARHGISAGSISGKGHVPSKPGEYPNMDTGHLMGNIEAIRTGPLSASVESKASYAVALEKGTSKMAARPHMAPAAAAKRGRVLELVEKVISAAVRKGS